MCSQNETDWTLLPISQSPTEWTITHPQHENNFQIGSVNFWQSPNQLFALPNVPRGTTDATAGNRPRVNVIVHQASENTAMIHYKRDSYLSPLLIAAKRHWLPFWCSCTDCAPTKQLEFGCQSTAGVVRWRNHERRRENTILSFTAPNLEWMLKFDDSQLNLLEKICLDQEFTGNKETTTFNTASKERIYSLFKIHLQDLHNAQWAPHQFWAALGNIHSQGDVCNFPPCELPMLSLVVQCRTWGTPCCCLEYRVKRKPTGSFKFFPIRRFFARRPRTFARSLTTCQTSTVIRKCCFAASPTQKSTK